MRFPDNIRQELEAMAIESGLTAADLIRMATLEYIRNARRDGKIQINFNNNHIMRVAESSVVYNVKKTHQKS